MSEQNRENEPRIHVRNSGYATGGMKCGYCHDFISGGEKPVIAQMPNGVPVFLHDDPLRNCSEVYQKRGMEGDNIPHETQSPITVRVRPSHSGSLSSLEAELLRAERFIQEKTQSSSWTGVVALLYETVLPFVGVIPQYERQREYKEARREFNTESPWGEKPSPLGWGIVDFLYLFQASFTPAMTRDLVIQDKLPWVPIGILIGACVLRALVAYQSSNAAIWHVKKYQNKVLDRLPLEL